MQNNKQKVTKANNTWIMQITNYAIKTGVKVLNAELFMLYRHN
jgi:hypothetical protein